MGQASLFRRKKRTPDRRLVSGGDNISVMEEQCDIHTYIPLFSFEFQSSIVVLLSPNEEKQIDKSMRQD